MAVPRAKLRLANVTVACADSVRPDLAARALEICLDKCDFADAVLFSDVAVPGRFRSERIAPLRSLADYSRFCLRGMPERVHTPFVLVVQWDGYVVDPSAWHRDFARYDYVGARAPYIAADGSWNWFVGNGGFSLRSRRLLDALPSLPLIDGLNEDRLICQAFRGELKKRFKIRFAPDDVADRFSYEQVRTGAATFGFHGLENLHRVESDEQVLAMVDRLSAAEWRDGRIFTLINECWRDRRLALASALFARAREGMTREALDASVARVYGSAEYAGMLLLELERLAAVEVAQDTAA